jgi:hypothetical protein
VADLFLGSGTTCAVAEKLGRRWIGCDLGRFAIHTTRKRLLDIPDCKPFEILNLGKYERKYWQGVNFGDERPAEPGGVAVAAYVSSSSTSTMRSPWRAPTFTGVREALWFTSAQWTRL